MSIICALPYGLHAKKGSASITHRALVVSKFEFLPSEDDYTFIALELSATVSRTKIVERLTELGLSIVNLYSSKASRKADSNVHLVEARGYVAPDAPVLDTVRQAFEGECSYIGVVGGYPAVPELDE